MISFIFDKLLWLWFLRSGFMHVYQVHMYRVNSVTSIAPSMPVGPVYASASFLILLI